MKLKWVEPGESRVVVGNSFRRKSWVATALDHTTVGSHRFCVILPGPHRVSFTPTATGMLFFAAIAGGDDACVAAAATPTGWTEVAQYEIKIGGKLAVFPGGDNGADGKPVIATTPKHGLHRLFLSPPVSAAGAELAYVLRWDPRG